MQSLLSNDFVVRCDLDIDSCRSWQQAEFYRTLTDRWRDNYSGNTDPMQRYIHITERPEMTAEDDYSHNTEKRQKRL